MSDRRRDRSKKPSQPRSRISSNPKRTGEHSEIAFLYRADQRQFAISKPFGDIERYDFILDNRPRPVVTLNRIQVKCTECLRAGAYESHNSRQFGDFGNQSSVVLPLKLNLKVHAVSPKSAN